jgi:predicted nuclease of predicted toxin-antitoxin system
VRILADECCQADVIAALREAGHDVLSVRETDPGIADDAVASLANRDGRILLTEDLDFGELAVRHGLVRTGVILLRIADVDRGKKRLRLVQLLDTEPARVPGHFVLVETGRFRFRPLRSPPQREEGEER